MRSRKGGFASLEHESEVEFSAVFSLGRWPPIYTKICNHMMPACLNRSPKTVSGGQLPVFSCFLGKAQTLVTPIRGVRLVYSPEWSEGVKHSPVLPSDCVNGQVSLLPVKKSFGHVHPFSEWVTPLSHG